MPIRGITRGKRPADILPGEPAPHVRIREDIHRIVKINKAVPYRWQERNHDKQEQRAGEEADVASQWRYESARIAGGCERLHGFGAASFSFSIASSRCRCAFS